jgi:hypothetical protein
MAGFSDMSGIGHGSPPRGCFGKFRPGSYEPPGRCAEIAPNSHLSQASLEPIDEMIALDCFEDNSFGQDL